MTQNELLDRLEQDLRAQLELVRATFNASDIQQLRRRPSDPRRWNALECFEHLNRSYNDYLPQIELAIHRAKARKILSNGTQPIRYAWLGKQAIRWATSPASKRYKTLKRYNPLGGEVPDTALKSFLINTEKVLRLIQMSREIDVNRTKVRFAVIPMLKYRLGNLLEFMTTHVQRHVRQAQRVMEEVAPQHAPTSNSH